MGVLEDDFLEADFDELAAPSRDGRAQYVRGVDVAALKDALEDAEEEGTVEAVAILRPPGAVQYKKSGWQREDGQSGHHAAAQSDDCIHSGESSSTIGCLSRFASRRQPQDRTR